jgi:putative hydrolase of the HAD superfamily
MAAIDTLLFDFGGTLDADGVAWKERFHALYLAEGVDMTAEAFAPAFFAADDPLVGALPPAAGLEDTVHALAANLEVELARRAPTAKPCAGPDRGRSVASRFLSDMSAIFARNRPMLEALGDRYRLGVVSNFYGNLEAVCESTGLAPLFGVMTDSFRVGVEKPDPAIFHEALKGLRASPETALFVGDSLRRDCEGARRAGIGFVWIAPANERAGAARGTAPGPIRAAVGRLTDLPEVLT